MKGTVFIILIALSISGFSQATKKYAERYNSNGTTDSFYVKIPGDSIFNYSDNSFVARTVEYYNNFYNPTIPNGFANYTKNAYGIWVNQNAIVSGATVNPSFPNSSIPNSALVNSAIANLSGTNTGDNAANTTYANDYRAANFVAGTNYLAPNGNGSLLTGITSSQVTASTNKNFVTDAQVIIIGNTSGTNSGDNAVNSTYANDYRAANFIAGTNYQVPITTGDVTTSSNTSTIGALKVTNAMLAGSIDYAKMNAATVPTWNQNTSGSAATLTTPRTIQGVSFNGSANINIINGTGFVKATGATISYDNSTYQPLATNLTSIGGLANTSGFLKNNGSGVFTYENPAGSGTVTDISIVSANGISGSVATSTSTPAITLSLGAITPTTVNGVTITNLLPKTTTSGAAQSPTASSTTTVTHNLGRVPIAIRIYGIGAFSSSTSATPTPLSMGVWTTSGNTCVYMTTAGTTSQASQTSTTFSIFLATSSGNTISGVIQNVTSSGFDIVWSETGNSSAQNFIWEAQ